MVQLYNGDGIKTTRNETFKYYDLDTVIFNIPKNIYI